MRLPSIVRKVGKRVVKASPVLRRHLMTSTDYRVLDGVEEARREATSSKGWLAARTVARQERAYRGLIAAMKNGEPRLDLQVAADAVKATGIERPRLIEVGCGSGYYFEVFDTLLRGSVQYRGVDYSQSMIAQARARYPRAVFEVADGTRMPYDNAAFDIVFNGVSLMHIIEFAAAIREAARVASRFCIFHTVPVFDDDRATTYLRKYAYGAPVVEIIFNKKELMALCGNHGLRLEREWSCIPYDVFDVTGHHSRTETYLFAARR
jgi:SAM-dependent methyltransferase